MIDEAFQVPPDYVSTLFDLTDRVAVVTGGGSGLGAACSIGFAQAGAAVVIADIDLGKAEETAATIESQGGAAFARAVDVTDKEAVDALADGVVTDLGRADILLASAGMAFRAPAEEFPEDVFDAVIALNLKGVYLSGQAFGRKMLAQGKGSIINMASIGAFIAYPWASAYLTSKGGVVQMTRAMALEWRDRGVRVNAIGPTLFDSPLTRGVAQKTTITSDFIKDRMLRDRLGLPREVIGAAIFLASNASEMVTGHTVMVDDGYLAV